MQPITIVLVHIIVLHTQMNKFWWGQMHLEDTWICQLDLLSSCPASQSCQHKCVWFGVNFSFHFDTSFSLHFSFFNWRRQDLQQTSSNSLVHQGCSPYTILFDFNWSVSNCCFNTLSCKVFCTPGTLFSYKFLSWLFVPEVARMYLCAFDAYSSNTCMSPEVNANE